MASPHLPGGRCIGLLTTRPAPAERRGGDAVVDGLRQLGLRACVYASTPALGSPIHRRAAGVRCGLVAHLAHLCAFPLRYGWALARLLWTDDGTLRAFDAAVRLCGELRRDGIVHLHACDAESCVLAESASRLMGLGFSMSLPTGVPTRTPVRALAQRLKRARFTLTASEAAVRAAAMIAPRATLHHAYPGVDYRRYSPRLRSRSTHVPMVLAVADAGAGLGIGVVIEACRRLLAQGHALRCDIVCAADDLAPAQANIDRQGLADTLRVMGTVSDSQLTDRYSRAAAFVLVPGGPRAASQGAISAELLEAMAIGLPVVTTRATAAAECVTHGSNGWLVPASDAGALSEAIGALLTQPRLGDQLGRRARDTVLERFDANVNLRTLKGLLDEAMRRSISIRGAPPAGLGARTSGGLHRA